ncbi:hypothetical protein BaRGS_00031602 [Batillaria attramentaria]|uniref:Uncharacterized protein n=1 Tax=Batillaria attramentaria TaxID=370345 RepID=A0ABD0JQF4_9CAEN
MRRSCPRHSRQRPTRKQYHPVQRNMPLSKLPVFWVGARDLFPTRSCQSAVLAKGGSQLVVGGQYSTSFLASGVYRAQREMA